jgi:hypothetical protein
MSEVLAAYIIRATDHHPDDGGGNYLQHVGRLHAETSQKTVIFTLAAMRT